jgi:replicative superfamily II helicase
LSIKYSLSHLFSPCSFNFSYIRLRQKFGTSNVGLKTGDVSINRDSRLTVMTTEVYRNIAWRSSGPAGPENQKPTASNDLKKNAMVILDEFHYMGIPGRGGVWEECVITSPAHTQIIGLSATLPNALQLAEWMEGVTGRRTVLIEAPGSRPVPLKYLFATREGLFALFKNPDAGPGSSLGLLGYRGDGTPVGEATKKATSQIIQDDEDIGVEKLPRGLRTNPALQALAQRRMQRVTRALERQRAKQNRVLDDFDDWDYSNRGRGKERGRSYNSARMSNREVRREKERLLKREMRKSVPSLPVLLERLREKDLLPAIFFIFSRAGCDQAANTIRTAYKGPRDPTVDINFDEPFEKRKKKGKNKARKGKDGLVEDGNGRVFRTSDNIDEDTFISLMEGEKAALADSDFIPGSPLSSENWNFYSTAGLLDYEEVRYVAGRVAQFNNGNPEIAFTDDQVENFLFGVGSHHAGMLPAHKALVETLFRGNFMKAVFATETLAAGINMPARTTVVCSLAKRDGSGSMNLLETSNMLQMAGRAGRRGMDTSGTCVVVATPFESHDVAAQILTNPIKPITSQFRPSYSLAVNLISRGQGKLDVAKQLVRKSFAMWEKQQREKRITSQTDQEGVGDVIRAISEERFLSTLINVLDRHVGKKSAKYDIAFMSFLAEALKDKELLKKSSKDFEGANLSLELEQTTLGCLEIELKQNPSNSSLPQMDGNLLGMEENDETFLLEQVEEQRARVAKAEKKLRKHTFSSVARIVNELMEESNNSEDAALLRNAFQAMDASAIELEAEDLVSIAKSSVVVKRKLRKLAKVNPNVDPLSLLLETEKVSEIKDGTWDDMLAITKVLLSFGCLKNTANDKEDIFEDIENDTFDVTPAGTDVGMLSLENSLWGFVAMGGTWDVMGSSSKYDELQAAMNSFESDDVNFYDDNEDGSSIESLLPPKPQYEAENLVDHLLKLSPSEMAGYVSCLVTGDTARTSLSSMDVFQRLEGNQQRAIQVLLDSTDRVLDVQRQFSVDAKTCNCGFDVTHAEVITAWADGCTWNEALELSGAAPGDLTRIISRATDGVRQFGSLKFNPLRKTDTGDGVMVDPFSRGIHPEIRRRCREAAKAMNRYPVKDPLPFEAEEEDMFEEEDNKDNEDEEMDTDDESSTEFSSDEATE